MSRLHDRRRGLADDPSPSRRSRVAPVLLLVVAFMGVTGFLGLACGLRFADSLERRLDRMDVFDGLGDDRPQRVVEGAANILVVGSDGRAPGQDPGVEGERTDAMILLHLDRDHEKVHAISIPRDTWVYVPRHDGHGGKHAKINAAFAWGGMPLAVKTVERFTGVPIDHVVKVDFAGFKKMVDALDGVDVHVESTVRDPRSKRVFHAGVNHLDGDAALDYVRQRYGLPGGDFDRMRRQQIFLRALMTKAVDTGTLASPSKLKRFLEATADSMTVDEDFSLTDFAMQFRKLRQDDVVFLTMPTSGTRREGGQSVVVSDPELAPALFRAVARDDMDAWVRDHPPKPATSGR